MPHFSVVRTGAASALALLFCAEAAVAGPVLELKPGLWSSDNEIWINGQSLKAGLQALNAKVRSGLDDAQKAELDRAAGKQNCLTPQQSRIDLAAYLESAMRDSGPWKCEVKADKLDGGAAAGSYACRTNGGGLTQGKFTATYGATNYRLELNGRGNTVDGRNGNALSGTEMDQRMLSTGRWLSASCS